MVPRLASVFSVPRELLTISPKSSRNLNEADLTSQIWFKFRGPDLVDADREHVVLIRQMGHYMNELEEVTRQKSIQWKTAFDTVRGNVDMQAPPREQGKAAARIFRQSNSLAQGATGSGEVLRGMLRALGVLVVEMPIAESRVEGCSFYVGSTTAPRPCIFANTHHGTWFRRNVILMHEVGHAIFEPFTGASLDFADGNCLDAVELRAQAFAQEVLVPKEVLFHQAQLRSIKWNSLNANSLAELVASTHVELKTLLGAATDAGFLTVEQIDELQRINISSRLAEISEHALSTEEYLKTISADHADWIGKRTTTIGPRPIRLPVGYVNTVVDAYRNRQISPRKAASYLMIDEQELFERFGDVYSEVQL